ncbi:MAG: hypothetical protein P8Y45_13230 [Exilibacterium sp.]
MIESLLDKCVVVFFQCPQLFSAVRGLSSLAVEHVHRHIFTGVKIVAAVMAAAPVDKKTERFHCVFLAMLVTIYYVFLTHPTVTKFSPALLINQRFGIKL